MSLALFLLSLPATQEIPVDSAEALRTAIRDAAPGQTIVLADGTYRDLKIDFRGRGEENKPITLRARTRGKTVLTGHSHLRISGEHLVVDGLRFECGSVDDHVIAFKSPDGEPAHRSRLTQTAVLDYNPRTPDLRKQPKWISIYGSSNRVDHCAFQGKTSGGTTLAVWLNGKPNHHRIDHNYFGARPRLGLNGGETIRVGTSKKSMTRSETTVELNLFEQCDGEIEIISNKSCGNVYRNNTFLRCAGTLTLRHGNGCRVEGNWFLGHRNKGTGGVRVIGENHVVRNNYFSGLMGRAEGIVAVTAGVPDSPLNKYFRAKNVRIEGNTFVDNRGPLIHLSAGLGSSGRTERPSGVALYRNVLWSREDTVVEGRAEAVTWKDNIVFGAPFGMEEPEGVKRADPGLRRDENGIWRPSGKGLEGRPLRRTDDVGPGWMKP